jgi:hypothetical protein
MEHAIEHQESEAKGAFFVQKDGHRLAEITYRRTGPATVSIDHTEVDASLRGQGVGQELVGAVVEWARGTGTKVVALCSYAKARFDSDASIRDVLA